MKGRRMRRSRSVKTALPLSLLPFFLSLSLSLLAFARRRQIADFRWWLGWGLTVEHRACADWRAEELDFVSRETRDGSRGEEES